MINDSTCDNDLYRFYVQWQTSQKEKSISLL